MNVTVREKPSTKGKRKSLYLDIYFNANSRHKEFLGMKVYVKPKNVIERNHNSETRRLAETIAAKKLLHIQCGVHGVVSPNRKKSNFLEYFKALKEVRDESGTNKSTWHSTYRQLEKYAQRLNRNFISFGEIDQHWLENFKIFILGNVSHNSANSYFNILKHALYQAVRDKIISENPAEVVKAPTTTQPQREYLTFAELQNLMAVECRYPMLKKAFIFSALTGLRWSDVQKLKWSEVQFNSEMQCWQLVYIQQKTKSPEVLPVSNDAKNIMGEKQNLDERVFKGLRYDSYHNIALQKWMLLAGITKKITFHCARHTFATLHITFGTDIYTVSKMLGHSELKTTQIYAKLVDEKKIEAVTKIPNLKFPDFTNKS